MSCIAELSSRALQAAPYAAPVLPAAVRLILAVRYRRFMAESLESNEQQQDEHRTVILALSGFSFTAALALPAYGVSATVDVLLPTFYVVLSFLCYVGALNMQAYKYARWNDQVASGLADVASFCLLAATIGMVSLLSPPPLYFLFLALVAFVVWASDVYVRMRAWSSYFNARQEFEPKGDQRCPDRKERPEN